MADNKIDNSLPLPLETEDFVLRNYENTDYDAEHIYNIAVNPLFYAETLRNVKTKNDAAAFVNEKVKESFQCPRTKYSLVIYSKKFNEFVGEIHLYNIDYNKKTAYIGAFVDPKYWGNGFSSKAGKFLIEAMFVYLGFKTIYATIAPDNIKSQKAAVKRGMSTDGVVTKRNVYGRMLNRLLYKCEKDKHEFKYLKPYNNYGYVLNNQGGNVVFKINRKIQTV